MKICKKKKLKTLSDLIGICTRCYADGRDIKNCNCNYCKLKREIIKWYHSNLDGIYARDFIKVFFNLNEEDIK